MGIKKKRKTDEIDGEEPQKKTPKVETSETVKESTKKHVEFDVKHFRKEIKAKTGQSTSLVQFLHVCTNSNTSKVDYLKQFIDDGGSANDILRQLDDDNKKNPLLVGPVFGILHQIFTRIQSSYPQHLQQAEETCRYFLNTYISTIDFMLSEKSNVRQQKSTLQLLTIIVTLNSELAFTVLNQLSLQPKTLVHLVRGQQNAKDKDDVRKGFIFFLMSFFLEGNTKLIKALLDKQGLVMLIVPDLVRDKPEIVLMVLELLKKYVIRNQSISKTIKIRTFNQTFLANAFNLFNWKGGNVKTEEGLKNKNEIDDSVYEFLLTLFTSNKYGVYFVDKYLGTGETPTNQHLWNAIESLDSPWNNKKAGELIIKIISQCPDLNKPILHVVEQSFDPRQSEQWLKTVNFLISLFNCLPAKHVISLMSEMNPTQITNFVRNVYLPLKILQVCNNTLNSSNMSLKYHIVLLLNVMLNSVKSFLLQMDLSDERFVRAKPLLKSRLEDFIPKHFPSTDLLISVLHSMLDNTLDDLNSDESSNFKIPLPKNSTFIISILDLLLIYNDILPNSLDPIATMLDSKRLLERIETIGKSDDLGELKLKIIMFLVGADKFAFAPEKPLFKEILHSMFDVYLTADDKITKSAKNVLFNILETTTIFERNVSEIDLLLSVLHLAAEDKDSTNLIRHIVEIVETVLKNIEAFSNQISSVYNTTSVDSSLQNYVDIYFENLDSEEDFGSETVLTVEKTSVTPFVIGVLKHKHDADPEFMNFSKNFLICLYHNQEQPNYLHQIIQNYDVDSSLKKYITNWLKNPTTLTSKLVDKSSSLYKISNQILNDEETIDVKAIFNLTSCSDDAISAVNSVILNERAYTFSYEDCFYCTNLYTDMIIFYIVQQNNLNVLTTSRLHNAEETLKCLLLMNLSQSLNDERMVRSIIEKCLTHKVLIQKFSPLDNKNNCTQFILDFITFCSKNNIETSFVSLLLKPYRHKLYMSLLAEIKKCDDSKKGVILNNVSTVLSTINLNLIDAHCVVQQLLKMNVSCMITEENEISSWIYILCYIIKLFIKTSKSFTLRNVQGISLLYFKIVTTLTVAVNLQDFEDCFCNYLRCNPECILSIPHKVFKAIFSVKHVSKSTSNLGSLLLKTDPRLLSIFKSNIIKDDIIQKRELVLPLTNAAFVHSVFQTNTTLIKQIYDNYKSNISKILEKPQKASQIYIDHCSLIVKLIHTCMDVGECENFSKKSSKYESLELFHVDLTEEIYFKAYFNSKNVVFINNFLIHLLQLANVTFKKDGAQELKLARIAKSIQNVVLICHNDQIKTESFNDVFNAPVFQSFFKSVLKNYIKNDTIEEENECCLFALTSSLINIIFPMNHDSILEMFEMTTSHSEFLNVMLNSRRTNAKTQLVKLLLVMTSKNKGVMKVSHLPVFLSSYHASMNECDRYLLCLLKLYENNGHSMNEYQPYLWGDTAANHYAVRSKRMKSSLWSNPTANHILNLLDKEMIERTIKDFPMNVFLNMDEDVLTSASYLFGIDGEKYSSLKNDILNKMYVKDINNFTNSVDQKIDAIKCKIVLKDSIKTECSRRYFSNDIYDPAFILPLLSFVVSPGSAVSCHRIIRGGILSVPFIALSSNFSSVRAAAFNVLHRFYVLLESEMYYQKDKVLWSQFMETLKSSLDSVDAHNNQSPVPLVPTLGALYLARSALVMTRPLDAMFKPVNNFVISKQYIDFTLIPDFLDIFHNTDIAFVERRSWMLKLLRDGIKLTQDIDVVLKSVAFKMILDFYSSSLCDGKQKALILEIVNSCLLIPKTAKLLVEGFGLFTWLSCIFKDMNAESKKLVSLSINLLYNLWYSLKLEINKSTHEKMIEGSDDNMFLNTLTGKCLKVSELIHLNVLNLILELSNKLVNVSPDDLKLFLNVFNGVSKSSLKNVTATQISILIDAVDKLYPCNTIVKALKFIVKDSKKEVMFNSCVTDDLSSCSDDRNERIIVNSLHGLIVKWMF